LNYDLTIITPVLNGERTIGRTLQSVISQTGLKIQYIVVDGMSQDNTIKVVENFIGLNPEVQISIVSKQDKNMYEAIQTGFQISQGEFFCYINADDYFIPNSLYGAIENFRSLAKIDVLYHDSLVDKDGWIFKNTPQPKFFIRSRIRLGHILFQEGVLIRRSALSKIAGVSTKYNLAGDFALWFNLTKRSKFKKGTGEIGVFSIMPGQLSESYEVYRKEMRKIVFGGEGKFNQEVAKAWDLLGRWIQHTRYARATKRSPNYYFGDYSRVQSGSPLDSHRFETPRFDLFSKQSYSFLFSTIDNRFGNIEANYWFLDKANGVASTTPNLTLGELKSLYEEHYSKIATTESDAAIISPFKFFNSHKRSRSIIYRLPIEKFTRFINPKIWGDDSFEIFLSHVPNKFLSMTGGQVDFLEIGAFEGAFLGKISERFGWSLHGIEMNGVAAGIAQTKGFNVIESSAEDVNLQSFGSEFDLIYLGQVFEHFERPLEVLQRLQEVLKPGGVIIMTTPNLDSKQRKMFGPTWAHWHAPYHRNIFSPKSLRSMAFFSSLKVKRMTSHSHGYWTGLSVALNNRGVGGYVTHFSALDPLTCSRAQKICLVANLIWDPILRGDYITITLESKKKVE
jgi:O-antigen biosynthesis protein